MPAAEFFYWGPDESGQDVVRLRRVRDKQQDDAAVYASSRMHIVEPLGFDSLALFGVSFVGAVSDAPPYSPAFTPEVRAGM